MRGPMLRPVPLPQEPTASSFLLWRPERLLLGCSPVAVEPQSGPRGPWCSLLSPGRWRLGLTVLLWGAVWWLGRCPGGNGVAGIQQLHYPVLAAGRHQYPRPA